MKKLSCDICNVEFTADTFDGWFQQMMPHYMADHADVMAANKDKTKEEGAQWMAVAKTRFEEA